MSRMIRNMLLVLVVWTLISQLGSITTLAAPVITSVNPNSGLTIGGNLVTIGGTGFFNGSALTTRLDPSYSTGTGFDQEVYTIEVQSDDKVLYGGEFTTFNNQPVNFLARLNVDGSLDTQFAANIGTGPNSLVSDIAIQPDGKILVVGYFTSFNGVPRSRVARLQANGTLDSSFNPGLGADNTIRHVSVQPDGKIILAGNFKTYNGVSFGGIVRVNSNGSIDTTFTASGTTSGVVYDVAIQPDGKLVVVGNFQNFNGVARGCITRLDNKGMTDHSFVVGTGFGTGWAEVVLIQPDGKILVAGTFISYNGSNVSTLVRLTATGSLDPTFSSANTTGDVKDMTFDKQGKLVAVGNFSQYTNQRTPSIVRLHPDGTVDFSLVTITISNSHVNTVGILSDNSIVVGGKFQYFDGTVVNRRAKLKIGTHPVRAYLLRGASNSDNPLCLETHFISDTQLKCLTPPVSRSGYKDVLVVNSDGTRGILLIGFVYHVAFALAFQIRDSNDASNQNLCNLGTASPLSVATCSYRLKVTTNSSYGYIVYVRTSGGLATPNYVISNAASGPSGGSDISMATVGTEKYGITIQPGALDYGMTKKVGDFAGTTNSVGLFNTTEKAILDASAPNTPDPQFETTKTSLITHNLNISRSTPGGYYQQVVTYTVVPKV